MPCATHTGERGETEAQRGRGTCSKARVLSSLSDFRRPLRPARPHTAQYLLCSLVSVVDITKAPVTSRIGTGWRGFGEGACSQQRGQRSCPVLAVPTGEEAAR